MIKCPNCGHDTFDDYKCLFCKYVLNPKTNNYDKAVYEYLKADYINSRNKAVTIKNGMKRYNKTREEIKEIVDYIADEIYDIENFKSKESLEVKTIVEAEYNNLKKDKKFSLILLLLSIMSGIGVVVSATKYDNKTISVILVGVFIFLLGMFAFSLKSKKFRNKNTFYFSFIQYFLHDMVYKILILVVLGYIPVYFEEIAFKSDVILFIWIWYFSLFLFLLYFLSKWGEYSSASIAIYSDKVTFRFQKMNRAISGDNIDRYSSLSWANYVNYDIEKITNVVERFNSFVIYGDIVKNQYYVDIGNIHKNYVPKKYKRIVIKKYFKNNSLLIHVLRKRMR